MHPDRQYLVSLVPEAWSGASALPPCPLTPDAQLLLPAGSRPTWVVPPEGNERCSGKSAPKPQPAHIRAVGSRHQSLFTGAIFSIKESRRAPQAEQASSQQSASDSDGPPLSSGAQTPKGPGKQVTETLNPGRLKDPFGGFLSIYQRAPLY